MPVRADGEKRLWGWAAVEGGLLLGSRTETARPFRSWPKVSGNASEMVFAMEIGTGA